MNPNATFHTAHTAPQRAPKLSRETVFLIGDLLPLLDFVGVLLAAYLGTLLYASWVPGAASSSVLASGGRAALAAAVLAPFILCDRTFVSFASGGQTAALIRCYAARFVMFAGAVAAIGLASRALTALPRSWLALWFLSGLGLTALTRLVLVATLRHLERKGILAETVAVVGAGPHADRLIRELRETRGNSIEMLGVFDDPAGTNAGGGPALSGSIEDLIELGKSRPMDWIVVALPEADNRVPAVVHRLKALAVPVGLCPRQAGDAIAAPMAAPSATNRISVLAALEPVLPRWILTLLGLPLAALRLLLVEVRTRTLALTSRPSPLELRLDPYDLDRFVRVAANFGQQRFGYVVTPNADHLIRLHRDASFRALYADATFVLLDSRFISNLLWLTRHIALPVCTGGDLTAKLFADVIAPDDALVLIGGSAGQAAKLRDRYGLTRLKHFNPPMNFIDDPAALEACLRFVEAQGPCRYCLLAVGAPQQELLAHHLQTRGVARGLALCIGASIDYLTGEERRAPAWMQEAGLEWLFRLLQAPGRMAERYLVRGPRIFALLRRTEFIFRSATPALQDSVRHEPAAEHLPVAVRRRPVRVLHQDIFGGVPHVPGKTDHAHAVSVSPAGHVGHERRP